MFIYPSEPIQFNTLLGRQDTHLNSPALQQEFRNKVGGCTRMYGAVRLNVKWEVVVKFWRRRITPKEHRPVYTVRLCRK